MNGIKQNIYDWYRNQTWLQEIALTYDASSHGGDKYEKVKRPYGIVHDVVNDMIFWTDAGTGHVVRSDVLGMHGAETPKAYMCDLGVPLCRDAFDATRVHLTMTWVVSFSISRPFGPFPVNTMLHTGSKVNRWASPSTTASDRRRAPLR